MVHAMRQHQANLQRVLVAYATRGGSTRELAEQVAQVLEQSGVSVDFREVTTVTDVASYRAVVLGSALYFQHMMPEARRFLSENASVLATRLLVLFSVGAEMRKGTPAAHAAAARWVEQSLGSIPDLQPVAVEHFAGTVELRRLGLWWRLLVLVTFGERGDWRDIAGVWAWSSTLLPSSTERGIVE
jgi:menaquinone-dependent protoporphyrinogen oxidase